MAKEISRKSCYPSRYGGGHVTIAQYITEYLCENIAKKNKKELPQNFWQLPDWEKFFKTQIVLLNQKILPKYHPRAVVKSLKDKRCYGVNSFGGFLKVPNWKKVLNEYSLACFEEDKRESLLKETKVVDATKQKPASTPTGKKSVLNTLRELDNGEESEYSDKE